jgi:endonuclease YncB( thermonuclease family)
MGLLLFSACANLGEDAPNDGRSTPAPRNDVGAPTDGDYVYAPPGECDSPQHTYVVHFVNDGDTFEIGGGPKIRLLGIDASEVSTNDCHSAAATDFLSTKLPQDSLVCLISDPNGDDVDKFDRWLRYAYVQTTGGFIQLNARALRLGHARVFEGFVRGLRYESQLRSMQDLARAEKKGGWGNCGW